MTITSPHLATTNHQLALAIVHGDDHQSREALETLARKEAWYQLDACDRHAIEALHMQDQWKAQAAHGSIGRAERDMERPMSLDEKRQFAATMMAEFKGLI